MDFKCKIKQSDKCFENGCSFFHGGLFKCDGYDNEREFYFNNVKKGQQSEIQKFLNDDGRTKYHFWLSSKTGVVWGPHKDYSIYSKSGTKHKYLGYTYDVGWPKKMNTGRLLMKQNKESLKRQKNNRKKLGIR